MKTKNYRNGFIAAFMLILLSMNVFSQAPPITSVGVATYSEDTVFVPITVTGFNNVGNISLGLNYDSTKLTFINCIDNTGLNPANLFCTTGPNSSGKFKFSYTSTTAIALAAPSNLLLTLVFVVNSESVMGNIPLTWSTIQGDCDMTPPIPGAFSPEITVANMASYFTDGIINVCPPATITGPATVGDGITVGQVYTTEPGMTLYNWVVTGGGYITAGQGTNSITVTWTNPPGNQYVTVDYSAGPACVVPAGVLLVAYYPFAAAIDPTTIKQFQDPLPHFAAGLRVNEKAGGNLIIKAVPTQQIGLSTGTVLGTDTIGSTRTPNAGKGTYFVYSISKDAGTSWTPPLWPAFTIEAQQGNPINVEYRNELFGKTYADVNILMDQTITSMSGLPITGNIMTDPYTGPIGIVTHLHGGEVPSNSDGGPNAWFTPNFTFKGSAWADNGVTNFYTYPNQQEAATIWFHDHMIGGTRLNVYSGLEGFYFLRGTAEEADHLPGWSGDDKVREITPAGKTATFNGANAYLPEIEMAIQDRMFNVNGGLYWPVTPTNSDVHPFWTPEFFGNVMCVNGKSWPYLSVAPRKYRFHVLDGCNARMLNMWLYDTLNHVNGPAIQIVGTDGGLLETPVSIDPATGGKLFIAPGERVDVIIDFTGVAPGTVFTLMNDAAAPYPTGDPVIPGLTDRIMQFVVNGELALAANPANPGTDMSAVPVNLRPTNPLVKLTNFDGTTNVTPTTKRELILNEVTGAGGPLMVLCNNSRMHNEPASGVVPFQFGDLTEMPMEGKTETWTIINTTMDAHPMHIHLAQWQLVKRQAFNDSLYMIAYANAWTAHVPFIAPYPSTSMYPGGAGTPYPYDSLNADGAIGGNPAVGPFLMGPVKSANPEERGWKDVIKIYPGEIATYIVRFAPTDRPLGASAAQLQYPFDPSIGQGYVWHCHIVDHEDNDMMRMYMVMPSMERYPQITAQPVALTSCVGDVSVFSVSATSETAISYKWQVSTDGGTTWTDLVNNATYSNVTTASLNINATLALSTYQYRVVLTNIDGVTTSNAATFTVNACNVSGTLVYNNLAADPLAGFTVTIDSKSAITDASGAFTINGVTSGNQVITVNPNGKAVGAINSTDAGLENYWFTHQTPLLCVQFCSGDVNNDKAINAADALRTQRYFVYGQAFTRPPWVFCVAGDVINNNSDPNRLLPVTVNINGTSVAGLSLNALCTGDFNKSFNPLAPAKGEVSNLQLAYSNTITAGPNETFDLTIRTGSAMTVGAASLILNIPSNLVTVENVKFKGSNDILNYNVTGNELRIGWNSLTPVNFGAAADMIVLTLKTKDAFTTGKSIELSLVPDQLNEIADNNYDAIQNAMLTTDIVEGSATGINELSDNALSFSSYPIPFSDYTTISYSLPVDGNVTLSIYNSLGEVVKTLVDQPMTNGNYTLKVDASLFAQGVYTAMLRIHGASDDMTRTIKFVVND